MALKRPQPLAALVGAVEDITVPEGEDATCRPPSPSWVGPPQPGSLPRPFFTYAGEFSPPLVPVRPCPPKRALSLCAGGC